MSWQARARNYRRTTAQDGAGFTQVRSATLHGAIVHLLTATSILLEGFVVWLLYRLIQLIGYSSIM
jgi:hypothetical protein